MKKYANGVPVKPTQQRLYPSTKAVERMDKVEIQLPGQGGQQVWTLVAATVVAVQPFLQVCVRNGFARCPHCHTSHVSFISGKKPWLRHHFRADSKGCPGGYC